MKILFLISFLLSHLANANPNLRHYRENNCHELYALYEHIIHSPRSKIDQRDINLLEPENAFTQIHLENHEREFIRNGKIFDTLMSLNARQSGQLETAYQLAENLLINSNIISKHELQGQGLSRVFIVEFDNNLKAIFKPFTGQPPSQKRGSETAAYLLDKALELGKVPPTVNRTINGELGSLQLWVDDFKTSLISPRATIDPDMVFFDIFIANRDRTRKNWGITTSGNNVAIDHGNAFRFETRLIPNKVPIPSARVLQNFSSERFINAIREITNSEFIDSQNIAHFLIERRESILNHFEGLNSLQRSQRSFLHPHMYDYEGYEGNLYFFRP